MANMIEKVAILQDELDVQAKRELTSAWMEPNSKQVKYTGGREVKIPILTTSGLGDYDREKGHARGSINLEYKTHTMTQDRGTSFTMDENDVDESGFIVEASRVMGEFQRVHVIPEIDAYRYSMLAQKAKEAGRARTGYTATAEDVITQLLLDIAEVTEIYGEENIIITLNSSVGTILDTNKELAKTITTNNFSDGNVATKIRKLNDLHRIIRVPASRMKDKYKFLSGREGQEFGFEPSSDAKDINWIIAKADVPLAITKTNKMRAFDPNTYQGGNMWYMDYRRYHDLWVKDNKLDGLFVNIKQA